MAREIIGPSEYEIQMVDLEQKFDNLLTFVRLMVKRDTENENRKKDGDKNTNNEKPEGHPYTNRVHHQGHRHSQNLRKVIPNWIARLTVWRRRSDSCKA